MKKSSFWSKIGQIAKLNWGAWLILFSVSSYFFVRDYFREQAARQNIIVSGEVVEMPSWSLAEFVDLKVKFDNKVYDYEIRKKYHSEYWVGKPVTGLLYEKGNRILDYRRGFDWWFLGSIFLTLFCTKICLDFLDSKLF